MLKGLEVEVLDQLLHPLAPLLLGRSTLLEGQHQVVLDAQASEHAGFLGQVADPQARTFRHGEVGDTGVIHRHRAGIRAQQTGDKVEGGGFARPVGTEQTHHLAGVEVEADLFDQRATADG